MAGYLTFGLKFLGSIYRKGRPVPPTKEVCPTALTDVLLQRKLVSGGKVGLTVCAVKPDAETRKRNRKLESHDIARLRGLLVDTTGCLGKFKYFISKLSLVDQRQRVIYLPVI